MQKNTNASAFDISYTDTQRFRRIVIDVMSEACKIDVDDESGGIGTLAEKQMHAAIKRFICPDESCHEVIIDGSHGCIKSPDSENDNTKASKKRKFVADILSGNTIYEIQTGSFEPLREKLLWILENTSYNIILIHPIAEIKWVSLIDSDGNIGPRKKSPRRGKLNDIARELYYIRDLLSSPRFSLVILMMEAEQYKKNTVKDGRKRPRYKKYELIPISLLRAHIFTDISDLSCFIPDILPERFTVKQYSTETKIIGIDAYSIVKTLCYVGLLEEDGKIGRAAAYKKR